jgi:hypothetical protein
MAGRGEPWTPVARWQPAQVGTEGRPPQPVLFPGIDWPLLPFGGDSGRVSQGDRRCSPQWQRNRGHIFTMQIG